MKKTTNHDAKYMLLKRTGMLYKRDVLTRPITMFIISAMATICDGLTVYFTLDPIIKDAWYFTLLLTLTAAAILDIFPAFWEYGFESVKHSQDHFDKVLNKTLLGIAIGSWGLVMIALCVIRYSAADFILESVIENNINANEYDDAFTPQVTTLLKMGVMTFMNLVNIGTPLLCCLRAIYLLLLKRKSTSNRRQHSTIMLAKHVLILMLSLSNWKQS